MSGNESFYDPEKNYQDFDFGHQSLRDFVDEFADQVADLDNTLFTSLLLVLAV